MKNYLLLLTLITISFSIKAQEKIHFTCKANQGVEISKIPNSETILSDEYVIDAYFLLNEEQQEEINVNDELTIKLALNGQVVEIDPFDVPDYSFSYQKEDDEVYLFDNSVKISFELSDYLEYTGAYVTSASNSLTVEVYLSDIKLANGSLAFDIPEYGIVDGDFCSLSRYKNLNDDELTEVKNYFKRTINNGEFIASYFESDWLLEPESNQKSASLEIIWKNDQGYNCYKYYMYKSDGKTTFKEQEYNHIYHLNQDCVKAVLN